MSQYYWPPEEYSKSLIPAFQQARDILEDWYWAIENGTVEQRMLDPLYPDVIAKERADRVVELLDYEFEIELNWASKVCGGCYTAGPGFKRLKSPQRIALVQQLHLVLKRKANT